MDCTILVDLFDVYCSRKSLAIIITGNVRNLIISEVIWEWLIFWSQLCFYHLVLLAFIDYLAKFWSKNPSFVAVSRKFDSIFEYFKLKRVTNSSAIKASGSRNQFWNSTTKPKLLQHQADKNYKICLKHIYMLNFN